MGIIIIIAIVLSVVSCIVAAVYDKKYLAVVGYVLCIISITVGVVYGVSLGAEKKKIELEYHQKVDAIYEYLMMEEAGE